MISHKNRRNRTIIQYSLAGIGMNLFLSIFKLAAGYLAHAHAIMLDGINSLSDMISALISVLATTVVGKKGSKAHPLGYGRLEYLGSLVITLIIIYIGLTTLKETIVSLLNPHDPPSYTTFSVFIMTVSLICKLSYGILMNFKGRKLNSSAMIMTSMDSLGDALISLSILAGIVILKLTGIDIEHYLCIAISLFILRTGVCMIRECVTKILGTRPDPEVRKKILTMAANMPEVLNVSNLIIHNYGEELCVASMDIEVDENLTAAKISQLSRRIIRKADDLGVMLTSVGISGTNTSDPDTIKAWDKIIRIASTHKGIRRVQSFSIDMDEHALSFYAVPDYSFKQRDADFEEFLSEIQTAFPDMRVDIYKAVDM